MTNEYFVWGACDEDGKNYLYQKKPIEDTHGDWDTDGHFWNTDMEFPSDKPQKFKLVPVEEPHE